MPIASSSIIRGRSRKALIQNEWPPPPDPLETAEERRIRLDYEIEATERSATIDREMEAERKRCRPPSKKILLLGQAESGKSTVLKNFQLHFAPSSFQAEMDSWRMVIYLNTIRSVNFILDMMGGSSHGAYDRQFSGSSSSIPTTDSLRRLKLKLMPLRQIEDILTRKISGSLLPTPDSNCSSRYHSRRAPEVQLRSGLDWKCSASQRRPKGSNVINDDLENAERVLCACLEDIITLWEDQSVQHALQKNGISLKDQSGFFLSDIRRIASRGYRPTSDDVLRARLQTIGVEEHRVRMETVSEGGEEWALYDVGGASKQRPAWAPFFDNVDSIIFLVPMSAFNENLGEEGLENTNRLADSFSIWRSICQNKILASVQFILLLNKLDLLESKLKAGHQFSKYVRSYALDQPNDSRSVTKFLLGQFSAVHKKHSPKPRRLHTHVTCAIDTKATSIVLGRIREVIVLSNLARVELI